MLRILFDGFYTNLSKTRGIIEKSKRKEISNKFFKEYGIYSYELIQLMPPFDEETTKKYGNPNPIIVFNENEKLCNEINHMKSKAIQFLSLITQVSTLGEKYLEEDEKNFINDKELVELINKIIVLIVKSFEDILNNKEKYYFLRKYKEDMNDEDDSYNILLFQICVFLTRSLIREPIKTDFSVHMKQFLLNILFPMIVTVIEDEINFLDLEPDSYHQYIIDISSEFKLKNFRTSGCFLVNKICSIFTDMNTFVLSFCLEMLNYILGGENNILTEFSEYNVYLKNIKDTLINQFNDIIKLDFALLLILILKGKLVKIKYFRERLKDILIKNQEKMNLIPNPIIKIKICKIYLYFLTKIFVINTNEIKEQEIKKNFIENAINYLLNNIIQKDNHHYIEALSYEASETILELLKNSKANENKENHLVFYFISQNLEKNFSLLNKLIENVDAFTFFSVIEKVLGTIKIKDRNLLFQCLSNLSKKFQQYFLSQKHENRLFCPQYFEILINFLNGDNKINAESKEEIDKFNEIFDPILAYIKNPDKFSYYESLVSVTEEYIKNLKGINNRSALVLKNIKTILKKEKTTSEVNFSFVSTFLLYIQKNVSKEPLDQRELFNEILTIINQSFSFENDSNENSKLYALLLCLQVFDLNPNLPENVFKELLCKCLNSFIYTETNDIFPSDRDNINQLSLASVSLGFIFKTDLTFKILNNTFIKIKDQNSNMLQKEFSFLDKYTRSIYLLLKINYPDYNTLLGKCIILGICGMLSDKTCLEFFNKNRDKKIYILTLFIYFVFNHKKEKNIILNKLMKKEMNCNFIEEDEEEEEEEEEEEVDDEFYEQVAQALSSNDNINNSDEFQFFSQIMKYIRDNEKDIYNYLDQKHSSNTKSNIEELIKVRNIKIKYNNKELTVPRKTVSIIRMNK